MPTTLTSQQLADLLIAVADDMIAGKDELTTLDAELGDGDLGRTISRGFSAIKDSLTNAEAHESDVGKFLFQQGKLFNNVAPSSFGSLFSTALMTGGKSLRGTEAASLSAIADATQAALDTLMERGGAKLGDKTMLDAMNPAIEAMRQILSEDGEDVAADTFFQAAADAAQKGAEDTANMQSQIGRASWQQGRSAGKMDPGARAIAMMLQAAAQHAGRDTDRDTKDN